MSKSVKATVTSSKEILNNIRFIQFEHTEYFDGKQKGPLFDLITAEYDFKSVWTIYRRHEITDVDWTTGDEIDIEWSGIKLQSSNKNFFGNLVIQTSAGGFYTSAFVSDSGLIALEREFSPGLCENNGEISITIQVYLQDERSVTDNYLKFLESECSNDVMFVFGDLEIPACKKMLSLQSDVFAKMFEEKISRFEITDTEPEIFELLLRFIYYGKFDCVYVYDLLKVIVAADKYGVRSLVNLCGYHISHSLMVETAADVLIIADQVRNEFLKEDCMNFIIKNKDEVVKTESYKNMIKSHANLLSELFCRLKI